MRRGGRGKRVGEAGAVTRRDRDSAALQRDQAEQKRTLLRERPECRWSTGGVSLSRRFLITTPRSPSLAPHFLQLLLADYVRFALRAIRRTKPRRPMSHRESVLKPPSSSSNHPPSRSRHASMERRRVLDGRSLFPHALYLLHLRRTEGGPRGCFTSDQLQDLGNIE